ncbi:MAG: YicC/YloC family endoribonuclease [Thermodesulfobacteriota bacterium]|nr:YicC/YloC family endoribonuclease [Thermodesulfobacteriota bacterium]
MPRSMTGFGRHILEGPDWTQTWEIRSVNSRHLDVKWRLPAQVRPLETKLEKIVRENASRGRVEINLHLEVKNPERFGPRLNAALAGSMLKQVQELTKTLDCPFEPDLMRLIPMSFLWEEEAFEPDPSFVEGLETGIRAALEDWNKARATEGKSLQKDLAARLARLEKWLGGLKERAPRIKEDKSEALKSRVQKTLDAYAIDLDQARLLQEIAILSDRLDVTEEITRLGAHLKGLSEILETGEETGKRLDFLLQECFREINTCGNKAQDSQTGRMVVDFKAELEKCREQVQNLE